MAEIALTQIEKDQLKADDNFKKYIQDAILGDDVGGIGYLLRLTSFVTPAQAIAWIVARQIRPNVDIVYNDDKLVDFILIQMTVRDIDKKDDAGGGSLLDQVQVYLAAASRINLLVEDYFAEKGKGW